MKKSVKIISALLIVMMLVTISTTCLASNDPFSGIGNGTVSLKNQQTITQKVSNILATIKWIAAIVAVIIVAILGIKYMLGSVEEKAEYKKSFVPLIVGAAVVVLALQIAQTIFGLFE